MYHPIGANFVWYNNRLPLIRLHGHCMSWHAIQKWNNDCFKRLQTWVSLMTNHLRLNKWVNWNTPIKYSRRHCASTHLYVCSTSTVRRIVSFPVDILSKLALLSPSTCLLCIAIQRCIQTLCAMIPIDSLLKKNKSAHDLHGFLSVLDHVHALVWRLLCKKPRCAYPCFCIDSSFAMVR